MQVKVKRHVTLPLLKIKPNGDPAYIRCESAMFLGKKVTTGSDADKKKEAATLMHVVDLTTGQEMQIICPFLMREQLNEAYPGESYTGLYFMVRVTRDPEKKYNHVAITEIEAPEDVELPASAKFEAPDNPPSTNKGGKKPEAKPRGRK